MKVSIIGLGWFGEALGSALLKDGHTILGTTRSDEKKEKFKTSNIEASLLSFPAFPDKELFESEIVVLNIPPFAQELAWFKSWPWKSKTWVIFISSTSQKEILLEQEQWVSSHFSEWTILRFGGLLGGNRHPGKHLAGRKDLPGRLWPVNLIHQDDCVSFTKIVMAKNLKKKIFNVVSDQHPTREEYYTRYCRENGLPLPEFNQCDESTKEIVKSDEMEKYHHAIKI
jgi:nucleoside-diphosphate-sugar epimerase